MKRLMKWVRQALCSLSGHGEVRDVANTYNAANWGVNDGIKTFLSDAAITRYHLVKGGSDVNHVAVSAADSDKIVGIALDSAGAAEEPISIFVLGAAKGTVPVVATGALSIAAYVCSNGDGTVKAAASGKYTVGKLLQASQATGDIIEMAPCLTPHADA